MKIVFCFILLFNVCYCVEDSDGSKNIWGGNVHDRTYRTDGSNNDHHNRSDNQNPIIRPCSLQDLNCIRRFFAHNSKCTPVEGPAPDPYILERLDLPIPQANLTFTLNNAQLKGLNEWKIEEFFINKATDRLVLEVVFDRIVVASPRATTSYHRKGKEPLEITGYSIIEYYGLSLTLTIPQIKDLQLSKGHVYAYVAEAAPRYTISPDHYNIKDPDFSLSVSSWLERLGLTMQEIFEIQGAAFMSVFFQSVICDFSQQ